MQVRRACGSPAPSSRSPARASSTARGPRRCAGELGGPCAEPTEVEGRGRPRSARGPQRERPLEVGECLGEGEHRLRLAAPPRPMRRARRRCDRRQPSAARAPPVRRCRALELLGEPAVQPLPLAGQDGRVDGLGEQRVAEAEAAPVGDEHALVDGLPAATRAGRPRAAPRAPAAAGSRPRAGRRGQPEHVAAAGRAGRSGAAAGPAGHAAAPPIAARCEQLLGEERVARGAGDDRVVSAAGGARRRGPRAAPQIGAASGASSTTSADARAAHAIREPGHAFRRRGSSARQRRRAEHRAGRRRCGPGRRRGRASRRRPSGGPRARAARGDRARSESSASVDSNTCNCEPASSAGVPERTQRVDERLERQLHADEVDRPADQHLEARGRGRARRARPRAASCRCRRRP